MFTCFLNYILLTLPLSTKDETKCFEIDYKSINSKIQNVIYIYMVYNEQSAIQKNLEHSFIVQLLNVILQSNT